MENKCKPVFPTKIDFSRPPTFGADRIEMEAGLELDKIIAEKVMGRDLASFGAWDPLPRYSTRIWVAWEVVDKLHRENRDWTISICVTHDDFFQTECTIETDDYNDEHGKGSRWVGRAPTASLAICRAALKAKAGAAD